MGRLELAEKFCVVFRRREHYTTTLESFSYNVIYLEIVNFVYKIYVVLEGKKEIKIKFLSSN